MRLMAMNKSSTAHQKSHAGPRDPQDRGQLTCGGEPVKPGARYGDSVLGKPYLRRGAGALPRIVPTQPAGAPREKSQYGSAHEQDRRPPGEAIIRRKLSAQGSGPKARVPDSGPTTTSSILRKTDIGRHSRSFHRAHQRTHDPQTAQPRGQGRAKPLTASKHGDGRMLVRLRLRV